MTGRLSRGMKRRLNRGMPKLNIFWAVAICWAKERRRMRRKVFSGWRRRRNRDLLLQKKSCGRGQAERSLFPGILLHPSVMCLPCGICFRKRLNKVNRRSEGAAGRRIRVTSGSVLFTLFGCSKLALP